MQLTEAREALKTYQSTMSAYAHAMSSIYFDGSTVAPRGTAANRAKTLGVLSEICYRLSTSEETVGMLELLDQNRDALTREEARAVFLALKDIREMQKIPMEEYVAYQQLTVEAEDIWHTAKETNDFALFMPYLERIFDTQRRFAVYCAPDKEPYDYCLGKYEDGLTMERCDAFFAALKSRLVPLIKKIGACPAPSEACLMGDFDEASQQAFSYELMRTMGIDLDHCGLATTEHPFTTSLGSHHDVRITTNYKRDNVASSMYSVIHEGGHALYDLGSADELAYTLLDGGVSMGIHESQSRFYENLLGRSHPFLSHVFSLMQAAFPTQMEGYTVEDVYRAVNVVRPSLIRTEADEVTYSLHIMVRYELEKRIMRGELAVRDLPAAWGALYKEYLGIDVPNDTEGVLQDTHWSGGMIGYFPSYALGSAYGAQLLRAMRREIDVDACLASGNLAPINAWNREHIWKYGSLIPPNELLASALGEPFDPYVYVEYLENKYSELYDLQ